MNKKIILIASAVVVILLSILMVVLYFMSKNKPQNNTISDTLPNIENSSPLKITSQSEIKKVDNNLSNTDSSGVVDKIKTDNFAWLRLVFLNNNNASQRVIDHIKNTNSGEGIIVNTCNVSTDETCLNDFKKVTQACGITADLQTDLPLAYDNDKDTCYQGYDEIISYLNDEEQANQEALRAGNGN